MSHLKQEYYVITYQLINIYLNIAVGFLPSFTWFKIDHFGPRDMFDSRSVLMISLVPRIISFSVIMYMAFKKLSLDSPEMKNGHKIICIVDVLGLAAMVIMKYFVIGNDAFFA